MPDNSIRITYKRNYLDGLEVQWRKTGEEMWQYADKSTETTIEFKPEGVTAPANIKLRGVYLKKNQPVGQWSLIYNATLA